LAEPAGAAGFAGLKKLVNEGVLSSSDTAVVMVTGNGLKDIGGVLAAVRNKPVKVENSLDDVKNALSL
jgi:threonine synthase